MSVVYCANEICTKHTCQTVRSHRAITGTTRSRSPGPCCGRRATTTPLDNLAGGGWRRVRRRRRRRRRIRQSLARAERYCGTCARTVVQRQCTRRPGRARVQKSITLRRGPARRATAPPTRIRSRRRRRRRDEVFRLSTVLGTRIPPALRTRPRLIIEKSPPRSARQMAGARRRWRDAWG